jgi:hypothetical protein
VTDFVKGRLYRVRARNFDHAIYDGEVFIGVRSKFGHRFLDAELHESAGPPHGTVREVQDTGIDCPHEVQIGLVGDPDEDARAERAAILSWLQERV